MMRTTGRRGESMVATMTTTKQAAGTGCVTVRGNRSHNDDDSHSGEDEESRDRSGGGDEGGCWRWWGGQWCGNDEQWCDTDRWWYDTQTICTLHTKIQPDKHKPSAPVAEGTKKSDQKSSKHKPKNDVIVIEDDNGNNGGPPVNRPDIFDISCHVGAMLPPCMQKNNGFALSRLVYFKKKKTSWKKK